MDSLCRFGYDRGMQVEVTLEETAVLIRWKKRSDNHVLVRMKAEAILYASRGVDVGIIAEMVERTERTVQEWLAEWRATRMCSVLTGHAGNQNAAKLTRTQKEELKKILAQPPSQTGARTGFRDVPAIRDVVKIMFDVEHQSDSSYQLLLRFCGLSLELPDPFDKHRNEKAITRRMTEVKTQVNALLDAGWEVYTADEARPEHEAETRRMQPPKGQRTRPVRGPEEDVPVLLRRPLPDQQEGHAVPCRGEPEHRADDPRAGTTPTRNRDREDRSRPRQRPIPPCESVDRPPRAGPAAGAHHADPSATVRARPQPGRARPERGQEQHRHHPARDPRRNPRRVRLIRHRTLLRLRLRAPPTPRNQKRSCFMTAIILPHDHFTHCPKNTKHSTLTTV
ncbi:winged helix-turn helix [Propionibacterium acidifaciens F0233]|uniref:Winged helix-turn helix n=1 Tax=Propionibacterium acidifaciens F0233 TaxID=553198 RepID=U2Q7Y1_9ACTN|nr:winged helix-turn helix [Propionibacterium acidifaciens F0233]